MSLATDEGYVTLTAMSRMLGVAEPSLRRYADNFPGWLKSRVSAGRRRYFPMDSGKVFAFIHDLHMRGMGREEITLKLTELHGPLPGRGRVPAAPAKPTKSNAAHAPAWRSDGAQSDLLLLRQDSMEARLQEMQRICDALTRALLDLGQRVASLESGPAESGGDEATRAMAMAATSGN